jgi:hypothetical protein
MIKLNTPPFASSILPPKPCLLILTRLQTLQPKAAAQPIRFVLLLRLSRFRMDYRAHRKAGASIYCKSATAWTEAAAVPRGVALVANQRVTERGAYLILVRQPRKGQTLIQLFQWLKVFRRNFSLCNHSDNMASLFQFEI